MNYKLSEIFDIDEIRTLCENFTKINGTATAILDLEGKVLSASGWQPICTQFHRVNKETKKRCTESDTILAGQLQEGKKYNVYKCKNGLIDVAMPIIVADEHVGNFFTGQFFTEKPNVDYFKNQAKEFRFDEASYLSAVRKTPIFDEEEIKKMLQFLVNLTETLGNIGLKNLKNIQYSKQLEKDKNNLKELNEEVAALNEEYQAQNEELQAQYNELAASDEKLRASNEKLLRTTQALERNISELKYANEKAEEKAVELREQQRLFETMFNTIVEGVVITNTKREILHANKGIKTVFGYEPEAIVGQLTQIFYADGDKFSEAGKKVFNENAVSPGDQYITYYKDSRNNVFPGETFGAKLYNDQGEWIGNLGIMRDISERLNFIEDIQKARERAEESDRLKTEFINNMSHEIRTPMNGILGFSKILNKPELSDAKRQHFTSIIQNSGNQLMRIIDDILEISKLGTKQVKILETEVCLNDVLLEHFSVFDIKAKENKTPLYLKKGLSDKQSTVFTDETKLNKILGNLLENALKFTNEGFIEFGYALKTHGELQELEIYVKDTGIGIKSEMHELIFERFSQEEKEISKKNRGGLGLGLSIAKENTELLGGNITLESEKGKGATFFITIPYKPVFANTETGNSNKSENSADEPDTYTILVVEDEEVNYLYIETLIEDEIDLNCKIIHAKNGKEAVQMCQEHDEFSLVLMDLKMPIMNGFEATKLIREMHPHLAIIAQTAYTTDEDKEKAFVAGCNDFISKPISEETLQDILYKYLTKKVVPE